MMLQLAWMHSVLMVMALVVGAWLLHRSQSSLIIPRSSKLAIGIGAFCGAMLGSKIPFALWDWNELARGTVWISSGKTVVTGLVGAYLGVEIAKWIYDIRVKTGDSFAVPAAVAIGIGRIGCFFGGCCYGVPTQLPWGVRFLTADQGQLCRHPTQIYEAIFHFSMAMLMAYLSKRSLLRGQLFKFYIVVYLCYRFLTEWIRPEPVIFMGLTGYQWFCVAMLPVFIALWIRDSRSQKIPIAIA